MSALRIGLRGYKITSDTIVYASDPRAALRKLGENLVEASKTPSDAPGGIDVSAAVRGGFRIDEIVAS